MRFLDVSPVSRSRYGSLRSVSRAVVLSLMGWCGLCLQFSREDQCGVGRVNHVHGPPENHSPEKYLLWMVSLNLRPSSIWRLH